MHCHDQLAAIMSGRGEIRKCQSQQWKPLQIELQFGPRDIDAYVSPHDHLIDVREDLKGVSPNVIANAPSNGSEHEEVICLCYGDLTFQNHIVHLYLVGENDRYTKIIWFFLLHILIQ